MSDAFTLPVLVSRLHIGRERRTALNEVSQRIREELLKVRDRPGLGYVRGVDRDLFCRLASPWKRRRFLKAIERETGAHLVAIRFEAAKIAAHIRTATGGSNFRKTPELSETFEALLNLTAWR